MPEPWEKYAAQTTATPASGGEPWDRYAPDYSANPKNEGLYEMKSKDGKVQKVPYSKVEDAFKTGLRFDNPAGFRTYTNDKAADQPSALSRFAESEYGAIGSAAKGAVQMLDPRASEEEKAQGLTTPYDVLMRYPERIAEPMVAEANKAGDASLPATQRVGHGLAAVTSTLAPVFPIALAAPWAANVGDQMRGQIESGNVAGAAGTAAGNAVVAAASEPAGKIAGKVIEKSRGVPRAIAEGVTHTSPMELRRMAEEVQKRNQDAVVTAKDKDVANDEKHSVDTQEKLDKTRVGNQEIVGKHAKATEEVNAHNDRVNAKHAETAKKIADENTAAEHALELRRAEEVGLAEDTNKHVAKEKEAKATKKGKENSAWDKWRKKTKADEGDVDMAPVINVINEQITKTPEAANILRNVETQEGALDPDSKFYLDHRKQIMEYFGYGDDYENLPEDRKANVDKMIGDGVVPEANPVDLTNVSSMTLEKIHSIKSNIGYKRYNSTYPPDVRYAMGKIYNVLDKLEQAESIKRGGGDDLKGAKKETVEYQNAFGKERPIPKTGDVVREKDVNPEAYKERQEDERLAHVGTIDPSVVEAYEKVKARREKLKTLKTEDELRKTLQQVPKPPSVGDLREGYNLKEPPTAPVHVTRDATGNLLKWDGKAWVPTDEASVPYQLTPEPQPPYSVPIPETDRTGLPNRPEPTVPKRETISPEELQARKTSNVHRGADDLRRSALRRAMYASVAGLTGVIASFFVGHPDIWAGADIGAGGAVYAASNALANLLEKPEVIKNLSSINERDVAQWEKLPPEQKALFAQDMKALVDAAKKQKIPVAAPLAKFVANTSVRSGASQSKSPSEVKKDAEKQSPSSGGEARNQTPSDVLKLAQELHSGFQNSGMAPVS